MSLLSLSRRREPMEVAEIRRLTQAIGGGMLSARAETGAAGGRFLASWSC